MVFHLTKKGCPVSAEVKLAELGLTLPPVAAPKGLYQPLVIVGNLAYTSGHLPMADDGSIITGRVGDELDEEAARAAARQAGLSILATLRAQLGSLDRVRRLVKLLGMVNCTPQSTQQPAVINGCSELFAQVFGPEAGVGVRSAMGAGSLPLNVPVEIEAVFEIEPA
jgi:enamine deaminase RidA (YjgF/YER057c/UK114 family)